MPKIPNWKCPHCGFVHTAADLRRADAENLLCKQCKGLFKDAPENRE
jgi:hypothetical protein